MDSIKLIEWTDSFGGSIGWQDVSGFKPEQVIIQSVGFVLYEDDTMISLAANYSKETNITGEVVDGTMTIPKCCIKKITELKNL